MRAAALCLVALAGVGAAKPASSPAAPIEDAAAPVLISAADWRRMAENGTRYRLFADEQARTIAGVRQAMATGIEVPVPRDPGGGYTHEQHKRNYKTIYNAGTLYRLTGQRAYADFAREMLLAYARLYPSLGTHPASQAESQTPGRLFWQALNDCVWLVHAVQGYDAIRDTLNTADRRAIDENVFRRMTRFLVEETPRNFDRLHNHATWAVAGVGLTGYVLRDRERVDKALLGSEKDGTAGFLRQIDQLFSPDGYYEEGPYYQRYALAPFISFARAIEQNDPERRIFQYRDGVLIKAVDALIQMSYAGRLFPINDALKDKGLDSEEIVAGIAVAYHVNRDPALLSIAQRQGRTVLSPEGLAVAEGLHATLQKPFEFHSVMLRDGPRGDRGGLAILRSGGERGQTLVMKNTAQGMGHGHFDKLSWLLYDAGSEVITDYGAVRFLNIEAKRGGRYLPENETWAKQTVAHNTLVVDGRSHFGARLATAEAVHPTPLLFEVGNATQIVSARMAGAYDGVTFTRTMAVIAHPDLAFPILIDLVRAEGKRPAQYDLPLHFAGHVMKLGFAAQPHVTERPVLGNAAGYQHLWVDAVSPVNTAPRSLTWLTGERFYTFHFVASAPSQALLVESGANDPEFNLRHEPALIQRVVGEARVSFTGVLEPHGAYDGVAETVTAADSRIATMTRHRGGDAEVIVLNLLSGRTVALAVADDASAEGRHRIEADGQTYEWTGAYARFDR